MTLRLAAFEGGTAEDLPPLVADVVLVGTAIDERGHAALGLVSTCGGRRVPVIEYDCEHYTVRIDESTIDADDLESVLQLRSDTRVLLEASTLGFVELFLGMRAAFDARCKSIDITYVEPGEYTRPRRSRSFLLNRREFELSDEVAGYRAVPGATIMLSDRVRQRGVFLLGFEERRLDVAFEDFQMLRPRDCDLVFGVPAFKPGWEMDTFANNIRVVMERGIMGGVHFCGANDPAAVYELLESIRSGLRDGERMFVAPIGTKPHGIAAALFAATHSGVGILYDHPRRRAGRTQRVGGWHSFRLLT
jgi:hypothetical protein